MTNLPIASNEAQSLSRGTQGNSPLQRNDDSAATGKASSTSPTGSTPDNQTTDTFSAVLARQIDESGVNEPNPVKSATVNDEKAASGNADAAEKKPQDQLISTIDSANPLAAMLLQPPVQPSDGVVKGMPENSAPQRNNPDKGRNIRSTVTGTDAGTKNHMKDSRQQVVSSPDPQTAAPVALLANAVKHMANANDHAAQPVTTRGNANVIVPGAASGVMPGMQAGGTPAATPQNIATRLGNSAWANEFSQKIVWMSTQQNHSAELHLNPPELGPLNVALKISDNQLTAQFTSSHIAVRDVLENALPKLREILADNNIMLGNTTISDQPPRDRGEGFSDQSSGEATRRDASYNAIETNEISIATASAPVRRHNGILDTFA